MSDPSRLSYVPRHGITAEDEVELLAEVYSFVLRCAEEKKAAGEVGGEEHARKELVDDSRNQTIPQP